MSNSNTLKDDFIDQYSRTGSYLAKNLYGELLSWGEILDILNNAIQTETTEKDLINYSKGHDWEIIYKDLMAIKKVNFDQITGKHFVESDATFFFSIFFTHPTFLKMVPQVTTKKIINTLRETFDIEAYISAMKIALSDKFVPYEDHDGNTVIIQLQGTNTWMLRDKETKNTSSYLLEPGDCLLFKEKMEHSLTNDNPRSSFVGNFFLGDSHER